MRTKGKERPSAWDKDELRALEHEIRQLNPEAGWIPKDADDPILQEAAMRVWGAAQE